jgi:DNA processing protein
MSAPRLDARSRFDWLRLIRSENVGPRTFRALLNRFGSAAAALDALPSLTRGGGKPVRIADPGEIEREMTAAARLGVVFVALGEPDYPALLREIADAPPIIAVRGAAAAMRRESVALVGSRNASALGLSMTQRLAQGVGQAGYVVVSGLARGVDAAAHRAALASGTVAVIAGGHARIYPPDHASLVDEIIDKGGAVVSEMPLGWEARGRDFPRRNRIVSGLSLGVVVVEAARRSGSLITARFAAEQGREVFAVPGHPLDPRADGPNDLLADGAILCRDAAQVVAALDAMKGAPRRDLFAEDAPKPQTQPLWEEIDGLDADLPAASLDYEFDEPPPARFESLATMTTQDAPTHDAQAAILALLGPSPAPLDEVLRLARVPAAAARAALIELELAGRVLRHDGGLVSRAPE